MITKHDILETFKGIDFKKVQLPNSKEIKKYFLKNNKVNICTILFSMKCKGKENIRKYIKEMSHLAPNLKVLWLELSNYLFDIDLPN